MLKMDYADIQKEYDSLIGRKAALIQEKKDKRKMLKRLDRKIEKHIGAQVVLNEFSKISQEQFKEKIESLVTMVIQSVFDRPFTFHLEFEKKRSKVECVPIIKENGNEFSPKHDMGGGILDLIGFAFRVVLWSIESPRSRNIFILDESFIWTGSLITRVGHALKILSQKLKIQIILVSHENDLIEICDRAWRISHDGTMSQVKLIKGKIIKRR
jgi:DNA repair exonuclease SbcCD ATPase subunit